MSRNVITRTGLHQSEGNLLWYKREAATMIRACVDLPTEARGPYSILMDLFEGGHRQIADDSRWIAGILGVSLRKWAKVRSQLIDAAKIVAADGKLSLAGGSQHAGLRPEATSGEQERGAIVSENQADAATKPVANRGQGTTKSAGNTRESEAKGAPNHFETSTAMSSFNGLTGVEKNRKELSPTSPLSPTPPKLCVGGDQAEARYSPAIASPSPSDRRGFEAFWEAFAAPPEASERAAWGAWTALGGARPPLEQHLAAVAAYRARNARDNASRGKAQGARPLCHPVTWLREHRWKGFLQPAAAPATAVAVTQLGEKGRQLAELIGPSAFNAYFADAELIDDATIVVASAFKRDRIEEKFWKSVVEVFGANVRLEARSEPASRSS